jgi:hypothetical protein
MIIIENEHIAAFDIDQTLFMHDESSTCGIINPNSGSQIFGYANLKHIELMKQFKGRGMFVVVWSKSGTKWAEAVVKNLELTPYVDLIISKFDRYVDDLKAHQVLGERIYLND